MRAIDLQRLKKGDKVLIFYPSTEPGHLKHDPDHNKEGIFEQEFDGLYGVRTAKDFSWFRPHLLFYPYTQKEPKTMKRIYITGQITGLPEEVWMKNFSIARQEVRALEAAPVCPTMQPHDHGKTWEEYMKEDLRMMLTCDAVYVLRNFMESKGAELERNLAMALGMEIIYQPDIREVNSAK